jgi:hypothetical protein
MAARQPVGRLGVVVLTALLTCGFGGERLVKVTGTAMRHGKPVPNLVIHFTPEKGLSSYALTDRQGRFNMVYTNGREGVLVGMHKVWVQRHTLPGKADKKPRENPAPDAQAPELPKLLEKYGSADKSPIAIEVNTDREMLIALD